MSRTAVVTGGGSGMGLDICRHLANDGHRVAVLDLDGAAAEHAARQLRDAGTETVACTVDVSDRASVDHSLDEVRRVFGAVEIMVTSAAIAAFVPFTEITSEQWDRMLAVDLTGTFHCLQAAIPDMLPVGWGRIVTIASSAGQIGSIRQAHYAAAKGGVIALTKTVAREFGSPRHHREHHPAVLRRHSDAARRAGRGRRTGPRGCRGGDPLGPRRHGRRHRRGVRLPLLGAPRATSPARSSASMAGRCCERRVGSNAPASVPFRRASDGSRDRVSVAGARA